MSTYKIAFVVGSLRQGSFNKQLAQAVSKLFPENFEIKFVDIGRLPLYSQDTENNPIKEVQEFKQAIAAAQGVVFFTPEYNRSMPGVLKNALDIGSRPYGQGVWSGKPAAVSGTSMGSTGSALAQQHLRNVLAFLNMPTMGQPELFLQFKEGMFDAQHNITVESTQKFIQSWVDQYVAWVKKQLA